MRCVKCGTDLVERSGKHGKFLCCPRSYKGDNHGTVTLPSASSLRDIVESLPLLERDPLMVAVERQTQQFIGIMNELDRFVVDGMPCSFDDEGHWMSSGYW